MGLIAFAWSARGHHKAGLRKHTRKLETYLRRVLRDIERKLAPDRHNGRWSQTLQLAHRLLTQQRTDAGKIFRVHVPDTECIAKGKLRKPYEFGHQVGIAITAKE